MGRQQLFTFNASLKMGGEGRVPWLTTRSKDGTVVCAFQRQLEALGCAGSTAVRQPWLIPRSTRSVGLEHLNLAFHCQGAVAPVSSPFFACHSGNTVPRFLPCPRLLSFHVRSLPRE